MSKVKWEKQFFVLNADLLDIYSNCVDGKGVIAKQKEFLDQAAKDARTLEKDK